MKIDVIDLLHDVEELVAPPPCNRQRAEDDHAQQTQSCDTLALCLPVDDGQVYSR